MNFEDYPNEGWKPLTFWEKLLIVVFLIVCVAYLSVKYYDGKRIHYQAHVSKLHDI